jgi:hypothetical protein
VRAAFVRPVAIAELTPRKLLAIFALASRRLLAIVATGAIIASLAGCGGGGGGGGNSSSGGGGATPPTPTPVNNTQPVIVEQGPGGFPNLLFTSVTICAPGGSTTCSTIDHIQVDTGSTGLRILSSALPPALPLRQQIDASNNPIVECAQFVDGIAWGPVKIADVHLAGEVATSVPIQVIGDPGFPTIPAACSNVGPPENTVDTFGANGVLGISQFLQDCGGACVQSTFPGYYYICPAGGSCQSARVTLAQQVQHPVAMFATDNNGVLIVMPSIPEMGQATASGSLIFGIGTQSNNGTSNVTVIPADLDTGNITTVFNNHTYSTSYIDSGSNGLFFGNGIFPACGSPNQGFYCPATTQSLSATIRGTTSGSANVNFAVANADSLAMNPSFYAFNDLAGEASDTTTFAWGMPFFYGRSVFTAIEGANTSAGIGPFYAF